MLVFVVVTSLVCLVLQLGRYDDKSILDTLSKASNPILPSKLLYGVGSGSFIEQEALPWNRHIVLPAGYDFDKTVLRRHLNATASKDWPIQQLKKTEVVRHPPVVDSPYTQHEAFPMFHSREEGSSKECDTLLNLTIGSLMVDERQPIPGSFKNILETVVEELDVYHDPYYQEIAPLFIKHLRVLLKKEMVENFWFRLSGSSVWLKDHGVHLVVSRFVFSYHRSRDSPKLSFVLAQVFDKNWKELKDVRLVFPTNNLGDPDSPLFKVGDQEFYLYRFPRILPVPFHHDSGTTNTRYYGPEDPRVILVRNKNGYDEPLVVFNAEHRILETNDKGEVNDKKFRSMFMCFPFQLRKGKFVTEGNNNEATDNLFFTKIVELGVVNSGRGGTNKNWSPMISDLLRHTSGGFDEHVYFATRLGNLEVLKCDLIGDTGMCTRAYSMDGGVGPLRGGTPLVNINTLIQEQTDIPIRQILPPGREVFVAFARAHLTNCGCGMKFYRPNLIVITKDEATFTREKEGRLEDVTKYYYKVSHVSGFMSLHVPTDPWYADRPYRICAAVNAVIPNGISTWKVDSLDVADGRWRASDKLTLAFSVSDFSVDRVNLRGVLDAVLNTADQSLFLPPPVIKNGAKTAASFVSIPELDYDGNLVQLLLGYSNTNIDCAISKSHDFCKAFGEEQQSLEDEHRFDDTSAANEEFKNRLKEFEDAFREAPDERIVEPST